MTNLTISDVDINIKTDVISFKLDKNEEYQYNGKIKTYFKKDKQKNRFVKVPNNNIEKRIRDLIVMQLKSYKEYENKLDK